MYQLNGDTGTTRRRITIFKTTDYWNHYAEQGVLYDVSGSPTQYSETAGVNLGGGNFLGITRNDQSGSLTPFESTNHGATWTRRPSSNLTWYNGGAPEIPWVYPHDGVFDFFYENRDATMMYISKGNTLASNFGSGSSYTQSEIYSFHKGTGGNPSLGYGSQLKLSTGLYLMLYFKEYTTAKANPQWTVDDLVTDPAGIPPAPTFTTGSITSTTFNVTITGQTDTTWQNIRYFSIDLSTHADFSDFVTAKYRATSAFSASVIQNTIALAGFVNFSALTTGTTYYFRIKACNNAGCSAYTTTSVSTPNDASVQQFLDSTGITDPTIISALNHYVVSEKADGGWAVCNAIYPMVGGTSATCAFNLKDPTLYKIAWNGSLTFDANGVIVNDQNSYGNTGIVPSSVLSLTSNHMSFYSATNVFTSSITDMGAGDGTRDVRLCIWSSSFNQGLYQLNDGTHTQLPFFSSNPGLAGWFLGTVTAANASAIYKNGVSLGTDAFGTCAALTNTYTIDLLNRNNAGSHTTGTDRKCSFATIGSGVSSTIAASMNTDIQTLQTALGR
jgi:hypothetical protein